MSIVHIAATTVSLLSDVWTDLQVVNFILQTMDPGNSVMRKTCLHTSMAALKEIVHVFPMVSLNDTSTKLAVGDAIGDIKKASIRVYDMQRYQNLLNLLNWVQ